MNIIRLSGLLFLILSQNQFVFSMKGPFSNILAKVYSVKLNMYEKGIAKTPKGNLNFLSNLYQSYTKRIQDERKTMSDGQSIKIESSRRIIAPRQFIEKNYNTKPSKQLISHSSAPTVTINSKDIIGFEDCMKEKIKKLMDQQLYISRAMYKQNLVNASKKVTESKYFGHSFNGF